MLQKVKARIIRCMRESWFYYDEARKTCYANAKVGKLYKCAYCKELFPKSNCECDHIIPIGKFTDFNSYYDKLFCNISNLQILCKPDHKLKGKK